MRYCLWIFAAFLSLSVSAQTLQQLYEESNRAYDTKDYAAFLRATDALAKMRPSMPLIVREHAAALALNDRGADAAAELRRLAAMSVTVDLASHDFDRIRKRPDFREVERAMRTVGDRHVGSGKVAFRLPKGLGTEAIAFDPTTSSFFVSCVRKRMILRIGADGEIREFANASAGIWGVNGMGVDAARGRLWASSSAYARSEGFDKTHEGEIALYAFDLDHGNVVAKLTPPDDGTKHFFDDLTVAPDGAVYLSDSTGMMWRVDPEKPALVPFVARGRMRSPQGSALDGTHLYVSDYSGAIDVVDTRTGDVVKLAMPPDFPLFGIDGVAFANRSLFVVQNGITPHRVARIRLAPGGLKAESWSIVEMNHPLMDEPTIGTVAKGAYWFVAASQGNKFDADPPKLNELHEGVILRENID